MVSLTYNGRLPSTNDLVQMNRVNRFQGASMKRKYTQELAVCFRSQTKERFTSHVTCDVKFFEDTMRRDDDNVLSGLKYIMDGLVTAGIIHDDSPKWCHVTAERFQSHMEVDGKKVPYITVNIEESEANDYT
nr:MAG TPA: Endodeoxyribonuclease RusA [Caudoviricetes sp.]